MTFTVTNTATLFTNGARATTPKIPADLTSKQRHLLAEAIFRDLLKGRK